MSRAGKMPALRWACAVALAVATSGCAHRSGHSRNAALADFAGSLPICTGTPRVLTVGEARRASWDPGDRLVVRGHLAMVAWGPPCDATAPPTSNAHCNRAWTLWDTRRPPAVLSDQAPADAGALTLTPSTRARTGAFTLPALVEEQEAREGTAALDVEVTVIGEIPAELCESTNSDPFLRPASVDCASIRLDVYPLTVSWMCRNPDGPPPAVAAVSKPEGGAPGTNYPPCTKAMIDGAAGPAAMSRLGVGDAIAMRGVLTPGSRECTEKACREVDREHRRERVLACCNGCGGWLLLRDRRDPGGVREGARHWSLVSVQLPGQNHPLRWSAKDCDVGELFARAQPEIVVSGVVGDWPVHGIAGSPGTTTSLIAEARICATGAWSEPGAAPPPPADSPWLPWSEPGELDLAPAAD